MICFGKFALDPENRRLLKDGAPVELGGRYFDALVLLVRERGQLVSKDRLHEDVWHGVPVTDEALSQAIMALRRILGDDAARPRFIETVPRHGYRFIAEVETNRADEAVPVASSMARAHGLRMAAGGVTGSAFAGLGVGLAYGTLAASSGAGSALSLVLVLIEVSVLAALVAGLGVAGGIGWLTAQEPRSGWRAVVGGGLGGLAVGGFARLLGLDTLRLLTGTAPDRIAGAGEGLAIGLASGLALWLATRPGFRGPVGFGAAIMIGGLAGLGVILAGGTLMAGSLAALVVRFPDAGFSMAWASDPVRLAFSGMFEGAVFTGAVVAGMVRARTTGADQSADASRPERR